MNVNGLVFQVQEASANFEEIQADEWLAAVVSNIKKETAPFGEVLKWDFELQDECYAYEYKGEMRQRIVKGPTSLALTPNSKMFEWYTKLRGASLEVGEKVDLAQLIGTPCYVMVGKAKPGKKEGQSWQNVEKVKASEVIEEEKASTPVVRKAVLPASKVVSKPVAKPISSPKPAPTISKPSDYNLGGVQTPDEIFDDIG